MSYQRLVINTPLTAEQFTSILGLERNSDRDTMQQLASYLRALAAGSRASGATVELDVGAVRASGTITFASTAATNNQTCTIAGVTWTAKTSATPLAAEYTVSTTPSVSATNLAAAINAYVAFNGILTASAALGVVTVYCSVPGKVGNGIVMANVNLSNTTIVSFANGTEGTQYNMAFGATA